MHSRLGFMQGRLSPVVDSKIQAFPTEFWRDEFSVAQRNGLSLMEWTIDHSGFGDNPLLTRMGRGEIRDLMQRHGLRIDSVTADNMMQAPFWKAAGGRRIELLDMLESLIKACGEIGVGTIVVPLVDNGALHNAEQEASLFDGLQSMLPVLLDANVRIAFESDFEPGSLAKFIASYKAKVFGVNYDMGNSASLGWSPEKEITLLGDRIINVHVKDRRFSGPTVPFGEGAVDFRTVFQLLNQVGYEKNFIIQGARALDNDHSGTLRRYCSIVGEFLHEK